MLPTQNRMRRASEFREVIATGHKVRRPTLIVHHRPAMSRAAASIVSVASVASAASSTSSSDSGSGATGGSGASALVGLVVGRGVGSSVVRHRVSRRLRAQVAQRLALLAPASATVVRALPAAAAADSAVLGRDLQAALDRLHSLTGVG